jgi:hypothetical protein
MTMPVDPLTFSQAAHASTSAVLTIRKRVRTQQCPSCATAAKCACRRTGWTR